MSEEGVTYSFKDLFDKFDDRLKDGFRDLNSRLDEINRKIDSKADNSRVAALEEKHALFEQKIEERFLRVSEKIEPLVIAVATDEGVSKWKIRRDNAAVLLAASSVGALLYELVSLGTRHG